MGINEVPFDVFHPSPEKINPFIPPEFYKASHDISFLIVSHSHRDQNSLLISNFSSSRPFATTNQLVDISLIRGPDPSPLLIDSLLFPLQLLKLLFIMLDLILNSNQITLLQIGV